MSHPIGEQLAPEDADALRAWAADERARADSLADALEQIAANGLPEVEDCVPWEEIRELALKRLDSGFPLGEGPRVP